jgi:hypothetical protein
MVVATRTIFGCHARASYISVAFFLTALILLRWFPFRFGVPRNFFLTCLLILQFAPVSIFYLLAMTILWHRYGWESALIGLVYGLSFILFYRRAHRLAIATDRRMHGCCLNCGYDLRASVGRCPECGTEIVGGRRLS